MTITCFSGVRVFVAEIAAARVAAPCGAAVVPLATPVHRAIVKAEVMGTGLLRRGRFWPPIINSNLQERMLV